MWKSPGGEPQIQDYLSLFLTAVNEGTLTLDTLVRITSYNPARIFGVYPRKGIIQPGADADMVIVDMNKEAVISNETTYTKVGWTPYHAILLVIGPEGGFSSTEADDAQHHGFESVQLGRRILRAETAAIAALSVVQFLWGDMG